MARTDRQTDKQTHGHGDSLTDPAQRAESVKSQGPDLKFVTMSSTGSTVLKSSSPFSSNCQQSPADSSRFQPLPAISWDLVKSLFFWVSGKKNLNILSF